MRSPAGSSRELPVYARLPVRLVRGEGCRVWDDTGRSYLDLYGGHAVAALGYGHPALTRAIAEAAHELVFQSNAVELDSRDLAGQSLVALAPGELAHVFFANSGAEANENALRLAFAVTGRTRVAALRGGFHGRTAAAAAVTDWGGMPYGLPQPPFAVDWIDPEDREGARDAIGPDTAAVIFEPVQGVAGAIDLSGDFQRTLGRLAREAGALTIVDEVQTGNGRTGTYFASSADGLEPDLLTTAKGLGGGFPVSAVLCTDRVAASTGPGRLATTFGGGPMACAAMLAVMDAVGRPEFLADVRRRSRLLAQACQTSGVERVTGRGFLLGLHLDREAKAVRSRLLEAGFLVGDAKNPRVLRLLPPLVLADDEIEEFGAALKGALA